MERNQYENLSEKEEDKTVIFPWQMKMKNRQRSFRSTTSSVSSFRYGDIFELNRLKLIKQVVILNNENRISIIILLISNFLCARVLADDIYAILRYLKHAQFNFSLE